MAGWLRRLLGDRKGRTRPRLMPDALTVAAARFYALVPQVLSDAVTAFPGQDQRTFARMEVAAMYALSRLCEQDEDIRLAASYSGVTLPTRTQKAEAPSALQEVIAFHAEILVARWSCSYGFARGIHRAEPIEAREEVRRYSGVFSAFSLLYDTLCSETQNTISESDLEARATRDEQEMLAVYDGFVTREPHEYMSLLELLHVGVFSALKGEDYRVPVDLIGDVVATNQGYLQGEPAEGVDWFHRHPELVVRLNALPAASSAAPGVLRSLRAARWDVAFQGGIRFAWGHSDSKVDDMISWAASKAAVL